MDVDATELLAARRQLQEATGERYGVTALVARFVVAGLRKHPSLNSSYDAEREELVYHSAVNLGLAAQTPRGLLVPGRARRRTDVPARAARCDRRSLRAGGDRVPSRRQRSPAARSRSTTTARSASTAPRRSSTTPRPRCSASGASSSARGWSTAQLAVRTVTELTISFDHRVCDGAEAAAFLTFVARCIERPVSVLAEL